MTEIKLQPTHSFASVNALSAHVGGAELAPRAASGKDPVAAQPCRLHKRRMRALVESST